MSVDIRVAGGTGGIGFIYSDVYLSLRRGLGRKRLWSNSFLLLSASGLSACFSSGDLTSGGDSVIIPDSSPAVIETHMGTTGTTLQLPSDPKDAQGNDVTYHYVVTLEDPVMGSDGMDTASTTVSRTPLLDAAGMTMDDGTGNPVLAPANPLTGDTIININNLTGADGDDVFTGNNQANKLTGMGGDDTLNGGAGDDILIGDVTGNNQANKLMGGDDTLNGGDGDDTLIGGAGADKLTGGDGIDTVSYADSKAAVNVDLGFPDPTDPTGAHRNELPEPTSTASGGDAAGDTFGDLIENLIGSTENDSLSGNRLDNVLNGGEGGNDTLRGYDGDDTLIGGVGVDTLYGMKGNDKLTGGAHADVFVMSTGNDTITDWETGDTLNRGELTHLALQSQLSFTTFTTDDKNNVRITFDGSASDSVSGNSSITFEGVTDTRVVEQALSDAGLNFRPVITSTVSVGAKENSTEVFHTVEVEDLDDKSWVFTLSGTHEDLFSLNSATGELSFVTKQTNTAGSPPTEYDLTVVVNDGEEDSEAHALLVTLGEPNKPPTISGGNSAIVDVLEGSPSAAVFHSIAATDAETSSLTYTIVGGADSGLFAINSSNGAINFRNAADYESPRGGSSDNSNTYDLVVSASDGSLADTQTLAINVTDDVSDNGGSGNAAPVIGNAVSSVIARKSVASPFFDVSSLSVTDGDGDNLTYSLSGSDSALFSIDESSGRLSVRFESVSRDPATGDTVFDSNGDPIPVIDPDTGEPKLDSSGNPILLVDPSTGTPRVDSNGDPIVSPFNILSDSVVAGQDYSVGIVISDGAGGVVTQGLSISVIEGIPPGSALQGEVGSLYVGSVGNAYLIDVRMIEDADPRASDLVINTYDVEVNLNEGLVAIQGGFSDDRFSGFRHVYGGTGDDRLYGDSGANKLSGGKGSDFLEGGAGADILDGGTNIMTVTNTVTTFDPDADTASYASLVRKYDYPSLLVDGVNNGVGSYAFFNGGVRDKVVLFYEYTVTPAVGDDRNIKESIEDGFQKAAAGDAGRLDSVTEIARGSLNMVTATTTTTISLTDAELAELSNVAGVTVTLDDNGDASGSAISGRHADGDTLIGIENLVGSHFNDVLTGNAGANVLVGSLGSDTLAGGGGHDRLFGGGGNDILNGGAGNDVLEGGSGVDTIDGGAGIDIVSYFGSNGGVSITLGDDAETATIVVEEGIHSTGYEYSTSTSVNDDGAGTTTTATTTTTSTVADKVKNVEGISGSDFDDVLTGNSGDNILEGWSGDDTLDGGAGDDLLTGDEGADVFKVSFGTDTITDFGYVDVDLGLYDIVSFDGHGHNGDDVLVSDLWKISDRLDFSNLMTETTTVDGSVTTTVTTGITDRDDVTAELLGGVERTETITTTVTTSVTDNTVTSETTTVVDSSTTTTTTITGSVSDTTTVTESERVYVDNGTLSLSFDGDGDTATANDVLVFEGVVVSVSGADDSAIADSARGLADRILDMSGLGVASGTTAVVPDITSSNKAYVNENSDGSFYQLEVAGSEAILGSNHVALSGFGAELTNIQFMARDLQFIPLENDYSYTTEEVTETLTVTSTVSVKDGNSERIDITIDVKEVVSNRISAVERGSAGDTDISGVVVVVDTDGDGVADTTNSYTATEVNEIILDSDGNPVVGDARFTASVNKVYTTIREVKYNDGTTDQTATFSVGDNEVEIFSTTVVDASTTTTATTTITNEVETITGASTTTISAVTSGVNDVTVVGTPTVTTATSAEEYTRIVYSIVGGVDSELFEVDGLGNVSFKEGADYEAKVDADSDGVYEVDVEFDTLIYGYTESTTMTVSTITVVDDHTNVFNVATYVHTLTTTTTVSDNVPDNSFVVTVIDDEGVMSTTTSTASVTDSTTAGTVTFTITDEVGDNAVVNLRVTVRDIDENIPFPIVATSATETHLGSSSNDYRVRADDSEHGGDEESADLVVDLSGGESGTETVTGSGGSFDGDIFDGVRNLVGGAGDDTFTGGSEANIFEGGFGSDTFEGGAGADIIDGGIGIDTMSYAGSASRVVIKLGDYGGVRDSHANGGDAAGDVLTNIENVIGSAFDDVLIGNNKDKYGRFDGVNTFEGGAGADYIDGGSGIDTASYAGDNIGVTIDLTDDGGAMITDVFVVSTDTITASVTITDVGDHTVTHTLVDSTGDMDVTMTSTTVTSVTDSSNISNGVEQYTTTIFNEYGHANGDVLNGIENLTGSNFDDILTGNNSANTLFGAGGDDILTGEEGNDFLFGGAGDDKLTGGSGADLFLVSTGTDTIEDYVSSQDSLIFGQLNHINSFADVTVGVSSDGKLQFTYDYEDDGSSDDFIIFSNIAATTTNADMLAYSILSEALPLSVTVATEFVTGTSLVSGGEGEDVLRKTNVFAEAEVATSAMETHTGTIQNGYTIEAMDSETANLSVDLSGGASGTETITGTGGSFDNDTFVNVLSLIGGDGADTFTGSVGDNRLDGGAGTDTLNGGAGNDVLFGGANGDILNGGTDHDTLNGGAGTDTLNGDAGNDILRGDSGNDTLDGGGGIDYLHGGYGNDTLIGGAGNDVFVASRGADTITDFVSVTVTVATDVTDTVTNTTTTTTTVSRDEVLSFEEFAHIDSIDDFSLSGSGGLLNLVFANSEGGFKSNSLVLGGVGSGSSSAEYLTAFTTLYEADVFRFAGDFDIAGSVFSATASGSFTGTAGNEIFTGNVNDNVLDGAAGNDKLYGGGGADTLRGGLDDDTLNGDAGADILNGGEGDDILTGGTEVDRLLASSGTDTVTDFAGPDLMYSFDVTDAVLDSNSVTISAAFTVTTTMNLGDEFSFENFIHIHDKTSVKLRASDDGKLVVWFDADLSDNGGFSLLDLATGKHMQDSIVFSSHSGLSSADLTGMTEKEVAAAHATARHTLVNNWINHGNLIFDVPYESSSDAIVATTTAEVHIGTSANDYTVSADGSSDPVNINLSDGSAGVGGVFDGDTFIGVRNLIGSAGHDRLQGDSGDNILDGGSSGQDIFVVSGGHDTIISSVDPGDRVLFTGEFRDVYHRLRADVTVDGKVRVYWNNDEDDLSLGTSSIIFADSDIVTVIDAANELQSLINNNIIDVDNTALRFGDNFNANFTVNEGETGSFYNIGVIDAEGDDLTYRLSGPDADLFKLNYGGVGGKDVSISFRDAFNVDEPGSSSGTNGYNLTVHVVDGFGATNSNSIQVTAVRAPVFTDQVAIYDVNEVSEGSFTIDVSHGSGPLTLTLSGPDAEFFRLDGNVLSVNAVLDYENPLDAFQPLIKHPSGPAINEEDNKGDNRYEVTIKAESGGLSTTAGYVINVLDVAASEENVVGPIVAITTPSGGVAEVHVGSFLNEYTVSGENSLATDDLVITLDDSAVTMGTGGVFDGDRFDGILHLFGGLGDDTFTGSVSDNRFEGGDGDDVLDGAGGDDTLLGGDGADTLMGEADDDILYGGAGDDTLIGGAGNNILDGGAGDDTFTNGVGNDTFMVSLGSDTITAGFGGSDLISFAGIASVTSESDLIIGFTGGKLSLSFDGDGNPATANDILVIDAVNVNTDPLANQFFQSDIVTLGHIEYTRPVFALSAVETHMGTANNEFTIAAMSGESEDLTVNLADGSVGVGGSFAGDTFDSSVTGLIGGTGDDVFVGRDDEDNFFEGGSGTDTLTGGDGTGVDTVSYESSGGGVTIHLGVSGDNSALSTGGDAADDTFTGIENLIGSNFNDTLRSLVDSGDNVFRGLDGIDFLSGGIGNDTLYGGDGNDKLEGDSGDDILYGGAGDDKLRGGSNDDILEGGSGATDMINGGSGIDTASYASDTDGVTITLNADSAMAATIGGMGHDAVGDVITNIENLRGGSGDDTFTGNGSVNILDGGAGDDTLTGGAGNDIFVGSAGSDMITDFGTGSDRLDLSDIAGITEEASLTIGSDGTNLTLTYDADGIGAGTETASITFTGIAATDSATAMTAFNGMVASSIDYAPAFAGTAGADTFTGTMSNELINGLAGDDELRGEGGNDELNGGADNDILYGGAGNDELNGGEGNDTLYNGTGNGTDTLNGDAGDDTFIIEIDAVASGSSVLTIAGGAGLDTIDFSGLTTLLTRTFELKREASEAQTLTFSQDGISSISHSQIENFILTDFADTITIHATNSDIGVGSKLSGGAGADMLTGGSEDDTLIGGADDDTLTGGSGADTLDGGADDDTLTGGAGADTFVGSAGADTIMDFGTGSDLLDLSGIDGIKAESNLVIGSDGTNLTISYDTDGDGSGTVTSVITFDNIDATDGAAATTTFSLTLQDNIDYAPAFFGTAGDDTFTGGDADERINGLGGNDELRGEAGNDTINGGEGNDIIYGGVGTNTLNGGDDDDTFISADGTDTIDGGAGIDTVSYTDSGIDNPSSSDISITLSDGGAIASIVSGGYAAGDELKGIENLIGGSANDVFTGNMSDNKFEGGDGNDRLNGGAGDDTLLGGDGRDRLIGGAGADTLDGGDGIDSAVFSAGTVALTIVLNGSSAATITGGTDAASDILTNVESIIGVTLASNTLTGDGMNNALSGGDLDDILTGGAGDDLFDGRGGTNTITGGIGNDTVSYGGTGAGITVMLNSGGSATVTGTNLGTAFTDTLSGIESVIGGFANDVFGANAEVNKFDGGLGADTVSYSNDTAGVTVTLSEGTETATVSGGHAAGDELIVIENLTGGMGDDKLTGNTGDNILDGGAGNDTLDGGAGNDTLDGGADNDTVDYSDALSGVSLALGVDGGTESFATIIIEQDATTTVTVTDSISNIENIVGSDFADELTGNAGSNILDGGAGDDILDGGAGNNTLTGGTGADTFVVSSGTDNITDFATGDVLDFSDVGVVTKDGLVVTAITGGHSISFNGGNDVIMVTTTLSEEALFMGAEFAVNMVVGTVANEPQEGTDGADIFVVYAGGDNSIVSFNVDEGDMISFAENYQTFSSTNVEPNYDPSSTPPSLFVGDFIDAISAVVGFRLDNIPAANQPEADAAFIKDDDTSDEIPSIRDSIIYATQIVGTTGDDTLIGTIKNDHEQFSGGAGNDLLRGGGGNDTLNGEGGNDTIFGGTGTDTLHGGADNDTLDGGAGNDTLTGGAGTDTFVISSGSGTDIISDFVLADDRLDFKGVDSVTAVGDLNAGFTADSKFQITFDSDGDGTADDVIIFSDMGAVDQDAADTALTNLVASIDFLQGV